LLDLAIAIVCYNLSLLVSLVGLHVFDRLRSKARLA
jgi:hypothetical protein